MRDANYISHVSVWSMSATLQTFADNLITAHYIWKGSITKIVLTI